MTPTVVMPIRDFAGFTRLAPALSETARMAVANDLADRMRSAAVAAGLDVRVVTADPAVTQWAESHDVAAITDPGRGLDAACDAGIAGVHSWLVVHADLPGVDAAQLAHIASLVTDGVVIAPSADGGTNIIGAPCPISFRFGPGSFHRHLADHPGASIVVDPGLAIELDTPTHLDNLPSRWLGPSLARP